MLSMARAVKTCQVFVPVVTAKYQVSGFNLHPRTDSSKPTKESPICKLEFDKAISLGKGVVPVYAVDEKELVNVGNRISALPLIPARFASIFSNCQASLDFRSHADWDNQMAVLKREILAKLNSGSRGKAQSSGSRSKAQYASLRGKTQSAVSNKAPVQLDASIAPSITAPPTTQSPVSSDSPEVVSVSNSAPVADTSGATSIPTPVADTSGATSIPTVSGSPVDYYLKRELENWLNPVSFKSEMAAYADQYVEGTREWAVDAIGQQFAGDANVVWLNWAAGVGKSVVAYLAARSPPSGFTVLSAFFCKHYDEKKSNAQQFVSRLVYDLASASSDACRELHSLMQLDKDYCKLNPTALGILDKPIVAFSKLFLDLLPLLNASSNSQLSLDPSVSAESSAPPATTRKYLIVIDALDECGSQGGRTRNEFLSLLASLNSGAKLPSFVKILATGRPEVDIWKVMESLKTDTLEPTPTANTTNIEVFVRHQVAHFPYSLGAQADECRKLLIEQSGGVFVTARVLCSQLRQIVDNNHGVDKLDAVAVVRSLGVSLDTQYARVLDNNIKKDATDLDVYMKFMYVLLAAKVPLDCANIAVIANLTPGGVQLVISKLHSLLLVSPEGKVTIFHKSVKDFLTSPMRCYVPDFHVSMVKAHVFVAQRCLAVLNDQLHQNMFGLSNVSEPVKSKQQELLSTLSPALRYSCSYWATHILDAGKLDGQAILDALSATAPVMTEFCTRKILQWLEVMAVEKQLGYVNEACTKLVQVMDSVSSENKMKKKGTQTKVGGNKKPEMPLLILARDLLYDVCRFAARFYMALDFNPLDIYQSALTSTPQNTKLYQLYQSLAVGKVTSGSQLTWGSVVSSMSGHTGVVTSVAYNHDSTLIASGSFDRTVRVWSSFSGALACALEGHSDTVRSVAFSHDGSLIASGSHDSTVRVWNPLCGSLVTEFRCHSSSVNSVAFNHNGSLIASGSNDNTVKIWNPLSGALVSEWKGHSKAVNSVAFNHDGSLIASASSDNTVQVWNPLSGALVSELKGHSGKVFTVAFNHDGSLIASGSQDKTVQVRSPLTGALVCVLKGHSASVRSVSFNQNGQIATGSIDKTIKIWHTLTGAMVSELQCHSMGVNSVAYNHDGSLIASGCYDNTVRVCVK
ncbi:hypothetical protein HDU84_004772, partial [Entophlyctis sp. JEL0112]